MKSQFNCFLDERTHITGDQKEKVRSSIESEIAISIAETMHYLHSFAGSNDAKVTPVKEMLEDGCGGIIGWKLARAYYEEFHGLRFPDIFVERYCVKRISCSPATFKNVMQSFSHILLVTFCESEHTKCKDVLYEQRFMETMDFYYKYATRD